MPLATPPISALDVRQILDFVGRKIIAQEACLNSLDAAVGDGDHGITMRLGFQAISDALSELDPGVGLDVIFRKAGMSFMGTTGGHRCDFREDARFCGRAATRCRAV